MAHELRRARIATAVVFFVTGAVFASWASRIPAVQDRLGLGPGELALAFVAINAGAIAGLPAGGVLVHRAGSRRALVVGFVTFPPALACVAVAPSLGWLAGMLG